MKRLAKDAVVHEKTVQQAAEKAQAVTKRQRQVRAATDGPDLSLVTTTPDPQVWEKALELAGGDPRRLRTESSGSVLVCNNRIR